MCACMYVYAHNTVYTFVRARGPARPSKALVSFRRRHESRISNWMDSGKRSNEWVRRGEGLIPVEIPDVISAIRL